MLRLFTNQVLYLVYFFGLMAAVPILEVHYWWRVWLSKGPGCHASVDRGDLGMKIINGTFVIVTALNVGIAQVVFTFLPQRIGRFGFAMLLLETLAWAYIIYGNGWFRNKLIGWVIKAGSDR